MSGQPFLEFNWQSTDCAGAPSSIFAYEIDLNSTALSIIENDTGFSLCSTIRGGIPADRCCRSAINPSMILGYESVAGTYLYQGDAYNLLSQESYIPQSASQKSYCTINSLGAGFVEYTTSFYLGNNQCFEGFLKCDSVKQMLYFYGGQKCSGNPVETYSLATETNFTSQVVGNFTGKMATMGVGSISYVWTSYFPANLFAPTNKDPWEAFGTFLMVVNILLPLCSIFWKGFGIYKQLNVRDILMMTANTMFAISGALYMFTSYYTPSSNMTPALYSWTVTSPIYFDEFSRLFVYIVDVYILNNLCLHLNLTLKALTYFGIIGIHLALDGYNYMYYWVYLGFFTGDYTLYNTQTLWANKTKLVNTIIWYIVGIGVVMAVILRIASIDKRFAKGNLSTKLKLLASTMEISLPLYLHSILIILFLIIKESVLLTYFPGNDRALGGVLVILNTLFVLHFMIHQFSFNSFKSILTEALKHRTEPTTAKGEEPAPVKMLLADGYPAQSLETVDQVKTIKL
ncbi:hypothetical protein HDV04_004499 [Boothiomyces sp. JEL0838]|nr:hypothetical protein HDV04_004499 [Boothiomyces sp. JEL0838]